MPRQKKQTVDYFPHYCNHKATMFILEQRYGNDGYSFWFKLLESLGTEEGHFLDLRNPSKWEYLQAKTRLSDDVCRSILNMLAKIEAIDPELWKINVVWSQKFVDGLSPVYGNRRVEIPVRPTYLLVEIPPAGKTTGENPQSKVKESKGKESKGKIVHLDAVSLTDIEYKKLIAKYGRDPTDKSIEILNNAIMSKGYKYKSHYHTLIGWPMKEVMGNGNRPGNQSSSGTATPKTGGAQSDGQPYPIDGEF